MKTFTCFEIVGPPGSGKTTLAHELEDRSPQVRLIRMPAWRQIRYLPFFFTNILALVPAFSAMRLGRQGRWPSRKELVWMICLNGWHRPLARRASDRSILLLDQGPVYWIFGLVAYRGEKLKERLLAKWLKRVEDRWAGVIDGIVWLDASDEVLAQRIDSREKGHLIKGAFVSRVHDFLEESRVGLRQAIAMISSERGKPGLRSYDTGRDPLAEIVEDLSREFRVHQGTMSAAGGS